MSKNKDRKELVGRVKKVVKKTQRKLSEGQFDKELQRTINFLSELKDHVNSSHPKATGVKESKESKAAKTEKGKAPAKSVKLKVETPAPATLNEPVPAKAAVVAKDAPKKNGAKVEPKAAVQNSTKAPAKAATVKNTAKAPSPAKAPAAKK